MATPLSQFWENWPTVLAVCSGLALAIAAVRYRIPDLARRIAIMEAGKYPTTSELEKTINSFQVVCKFNQASCQKQTACQMNTMKSEFTKQLGDLINLVNKQALVIARVDERVAALYRNHDHNFVPPKESVSDGNL